MWELHDYTNGKNSGYLSLTMNGVRVCDAFPYGRGVDSEWVRLQIRKVFETMARESGQAAVE